MAAFHNITSQLSVNGEAGADVNFDRKKDAFTGQVDYIGAYHYSTDKVQNIKPYTQVGLDYTCHW